ncbi:hypothetical protein [Deinococcus apachensis]|uniref:hypothetical protein n=1 Tax=Deinococcus apachensis TaxID=309886 RepID=UPI000362EE51|nr:hypothetical protein [Deinococcus apachensis]
MGGTTSTGQSAYPTVRVYAERYCSGVAGLVLIDPWHEDVPAAMVNFFRSNPPARAGLSGEMNDWLNEFHSYVQAYQAGHAPPMMQWDIRAGDQQARSVRPFGKLPVVVVTSRFNMFSGMGEEPTVTYGQRMTQVFATQQTKLLKISSNSRQSFFDLDDPNNKAITETEVEEAAVRAVLDAARRGTPLPRSIPVP